MALRVRMLLIIRSSRETPGSFSITTVEYPYVTTRDRRTSQTIAMEQDCPNHYFPSCHPLSILPPT